MESVSFTFDWYGSFLSRFREVGRSFQPFDAEPGPPSIFLRHDVDFSPRKALRMAGIEAERDVSATYFFLLTSPLYNGFDAEIRRVVAEIEDLGHEVGLHFDASQYWDGEPEEEVLTDQINEELRAMDTFVDDPIDVIAFHNPEDWVLDRTFDDFSHTYEPRFFSEMAYVADSNHRWRTDPPFPDGIPETVQVLTHPVLWDDADRTKNEVLRIERERYRDRVDHAINAAMIDNPPS